MSALIHLTQEVSTQALAGHLMAAPPASGEGILDWLTSKNSQTQTLLRAVAVTLAIIFVIVQAVASRGAMARIIISLVAAGIFVWGVWSVTDIKDRVDNEVNASGPAVVQVGPGSPAAPAVLTGPAVLALSTS